VRETLLKFHLAAFLVWGLSGVASASAGQSILPPPPSAPDVIARDPASGRMTIRVSRLTAPIHVDGRLDPRFFAQPREEVQP